MSARASRHGRTRREALAELTLGAAALTLPGCGTGRDSIAAAPDGSTLQSTYVDPREDGVLGVGPGVELIDRTELAPRATPGAIRCTIAHLTDAHVMDAQSPARVPFLRRLGAPFNSTFRPQEGLTAHVLAGAVRAVDALAPDVVIQGGDLIDNAQSNELVQALALLRGGMVDPDSGSPGYVGVQSADDPDPFYYRPDIDAPRHPGLLAEAVRRFTAGGLTAPWYPVLGDHDLLVQGVLTPSPLTDEIAVGSQAVWHLPSTLALPQGSAAAATATVTSSPDGLSDPATIASLIEELRQAPSVTVAADSGRRELAASEVIARLRAGSRLRWRRAADELQLRRRHAGTGDRARSGSPRWRLRRDRAERPGGLACR